MYQNQDKWFDIVMFYIGGIVICYIGGNWATS
jgi:hypothetical protein